MRSLLSPRAKTSTPSGSPAAEIDSACGTSSRRVSACDSPFSVAFRPPTSPDVAISGSPDGSLTTLTAPSSPPDAAQLLAENAQLKESLDRVNAEYRRLLDHAIENDQRLLSFTDQVFATSGAKDAPRLSVADFAVQVDLPPANCRDQRCAVTRDLVGSLKTSMEVLEAEVSYLKNELASRPSPVVEEWFAGSVISRTNNPALLKTKNRFAPLQAEKAAERETGPGGTAHLKQKKPPPKSSVRRRNRRSGGKKEEATPVNHQMELPVVSVVIEGDSHARHLADHLQRCVAPSTKVSGVCKPNAKLTSVLADAAVQPRSCCILLAGTNDIDAGEPQNIYRDLEPQIARRLAKADVIVADLPLRHDLPQGHPVHHHTTMANGYIEELCQRYNIQVAKMSHIPRRFFTRHGMHLRPAGKRLFTGFLVDSLRRTLLRGDAGLKPAVTEVTETTGPAVSALVPSREPAVVVTPGPVSYSEAVRTPLQTRQPFFLTIRPQASGQG